MCPSPAKLRIRRRPEARMPSSKKPHASASMPPSAKGGSATMGGTRTLRLDLPSTCVLVLGLLSSTYLSFLAGCRLHVALSTQSEHPLQPSTPLHVVRTSEDAQLPSGQHLYVDIRNAYQQSLGSEEHLVAAMISLSEVHELSMLSYHCHRVPEDLSIAGVTCVAVLLDGLLTVHTHPSDGTMHLDLFSKSKDLIPMLHTVERLFATPTTLNASSTAADLQPEMRWSHQLRGFRQGFAGYRRDKNPYDQELGEDILRRTDFERKTPVVSLTTKFQHMDVFELVHKKGTAYAALGSKPIHSTTESNVVPDRALFIDGVLQSSMYGEAAYHEALVHPALLSHPDPRRVAIIGGGEGATLREVLKHTTVEEAVMVEIDGELAKASRAYLPEWSDCSDIVGCDAESCFDESRATILYEDAFGYFLENFGEDDEDEDEENSGIELEEAFDVIVMDALDPDDFGPFVDKLYSDTEFIESLYDGLTDSGVLVVQVGSISALSEPPDEMSPFYNRAAMLDKLEEVGFERIHTYDEGHCHFYSPWQFLVAFKDAGVGLAGWRRTSAEVELELRWRLSRTRSERPVLRFFDGPTMMGYQIAPKVVETHYCRKVGSAAECQHPGIRLSSPDRRLSSQPIQQLSNAFTFARGCNSTFDHAGDLPVYSPVIDRRYPGGHSMCK